MAIRNAERWGGLKRKPYTKAEGREGTEVGGGYERPRRSGSEVRGWSIRVRGGGPGGACGEEVHL